MSLLVSVYSILFYSILFYSVLFCSVHQVGSCFVHADSSSLFSWCHFQVCAVQALPRQTSLLSILTFIYHRVI